MRPGLIGAVVLLTGCLNASSEYQCHTDNECVWNGLTGRCEDNQWCSFPDSSCAGSERRYAAHSGAQSSECLAFTPVDAALGPARPNRFRDDGNSDMKPVIDPNYNWPGDDLSRPENTDMGSAGHSTDLAKNQSDLAASDMASKPPGECGGTAEPCCKIGPACLGLALCVAGICL